MKTKYCNIRMALVFCLGFSLDTGLIHSMNVAKEAKEQIKPTSKKEPTLKTTIPLPKKAPPAPSEKKSIEANEKDDTLTLDGIFNYIRGLITTGADEAIINVLKNICVEEKIVAILTRIVKEKNSTLSREDKLNILFSLAQFYQNKTKTKKEILDIIKRENLIESDPPLLIIAVDSKNEKIIPHVIEWDKKHTGEKKSKIAKNSLRFAVKSSLSKHLKEIHKHIAPFEEDHATELLLLLVKTNQKADAIPFLVKHGAKVNAVDKETQLTPLILAIKKRNFEMVKKLVEAGADVNQRVKIVKDKKLHTVETPLWAARDAKDAKIEIYLKQNKAKD